MFPINTYTPTVYTISFSVTSIHQILSWTVIYSTNFQIQFFRKNRKEKKSSKIISQRNSIDCHFLPRNLPNFNCTTNSDSQMYLFFFLYTTCFFFSFFCCVSRCMRVPACLYVSNPTDRLRFHSNRLTFQLVYQSSRICCSTQRFEIQSVLLYFFQSRSPANPVVRKRLVGGFCGLSERSEVRKELFRMRTLSIERV